MSTLAAVVASRWFRSVMVLLALIAAACASEDPTETSAIGRQAVDASEEAQAAGDGGASDADADDEDGHGEEDHGGDDHAHAEVVDVDRALPVPGVVMEVFEDGEPGEYLLLVELSNFTVTPDAVDGEPVPNEGHMHLLVDGAKVERFFDLEHRFTLQPGQHIVEVELNANDHRPWAVDGARINATALVEVPGAAPEAGVVVTASYRDGEVTTDADRVEVPFESDVLVLVSSDVTEELHLHGYDIVAPVTPESGGQLRFFADIPGTFEVELERSGTFVVEFVVRAN